MHSLSGDLQDVMSIITAKGALRQCSCCVNIIERQISSGLDITMIWCIGSGCECLIEL